jgi:hypothetical protein
MMTMMGWYRGDNLTTSDKSCISVAAFLQGELLDKLSD